MNKVNKTRFVIETPEEFGRITKHICYGIKEAEARADSLIAKNADYHLDYYIKCFEGIDHPEDKYEDHLCRVRDYNGDYCWRMMRMGSYMPIGIEELTKDERQHLDELYDE